MYDKVQKLTSRHSRTKPKSSKEDKHRKNNMCIDTLCTFSFRHDPYHCCCQYHFHCHHIRDHERYSTDRHVLGYRVSLFVAIFSGDDGPVDGVTVASFFCVGLLEGKTSLASLIVEPVSN